MKDEIVQMGKDFSDILGLFADRLYKINDEVLKYSEMGERLSEQRNRFAHGNLNKDL